MNYIVSASTDIGNTKQTNQDSFSACVLDTPYGKAGLFVMCDGMGGLSKGEVASATVTRAFRKWMDGRFTELVTEGMVSDETIRREWMNLILTYNSKIRQYGFQEGVQLGTTLNALLIFNGRCFIVNVGDSRTYEVTDGLRRLTEDQSVVAREIREGRLTEEQAKHDARRSVLLQCIGVMETVEPDFYFLDAKTDAVYFLCTDGFRHEISEEEILNAYLPGRMTTAEEMKNASDELIRTCMARGERDNISVLTVRTF